MKEAICKARNASKNNKRKNAAHEGEIIVQRELPPGTVTANERHAGAAIPRVREKT